MHAAPTARPLAADRPFFLTSRCLPLLGGLLAVAGGWPGVARAADAPKPAVAASAAPRPALTVTLVSPQRAQLPQQVPATGSIAAWQEASVGAEVAGLRLAKVLVNVGDTVRRGQLLAEFATETVQADLAQLRAQVVQAEAQLEEAQANARRARELQESGAWSKQQIEQNLTAERTAQARLEAARASAKAQELRLAQTRVLAPDDGVITARAATLGAVANPGQELFRLIRQGRLEWRAEVSAADLPRVRRGMAASLTPPGGQPLTGTVRMVAPTVDAATRNGLIYVDLPNPGSARAGMFARGHLALEASPALTLPASAVVLRDGFAYVFRVGADRRLVMSKVATGRRTADRVEVTQGLDAAARVVASGTGFLVDGDLVKVVDGPASAPVPAPAASVAAR
ncbi:efflux RND transporter periplasmic adaptor subunit [Sphaerotilus microaerophilus]|uniref:Secretion protein HlyD n=1 Tax=Sphaerotilus microaerophilus TaxID=2914710 RepID=A0ABN6PIZ4_9BURK|nr:efflux RND transporter periplasmic adaptor subunit [Sphaerotilus sp. FB-5]BDI03979.1 secretion protein HlyD [Sphaerotilus sp. FB-5]